MEEKILFLIKEIFVNVEADCFVENGNLEISGGNITVFWENLDLMEIQLIWMEVTIKGGTLFVEDNQGIN